MFESRHSDYLKEAEKPHFQGQYLEDAVFRCFIGNFVEFPIKLSGRERTAAEWNYVAEATRRKRLMRMFFLAAGFCM